MDDFHGRSKQDVLKIGSIIEYSDEFYIKNSDNYKDYTVHLKVVRIKLHTFLVHAEKFIGLSEGEEKDCYFHRGSTRTINFGSYMDCMSRLINRRKVIG